MMNRSRPGLASFAFIIVLPLSAFGGGQVSVGISSGGRIAAGLSAFSHNRNSRASVFVRVGRRWVSAPGGYYFPPVPESYPIRSQRQFSGTDPSGALYINGYRVLPSGWLRVKVEPMDADVLVDGFSVPIDKISGISGSVGFPVGVRQVEVRKAGFQAVQTEVEIKQASEILLQVQLVR